MHERRSAGPSDHGNPGSQDAGLSGTGLMADDLYLLAHDDRTGKPLLPPRPLGTGLAGALLAEVLLSGCIGLRSDTAVVIGYCAGRAAICGLKDRSSWPDSPHPHASHRPPQGGVAGRDHDGPRRIRQRPDPHRAHPARREVERTLALRQASSGRVFRRQEADEPSPAQRAMPSRGSFRRARSQSARI